MSRNDELPGDDFDEVRIDRPPENRTMAVWSHWGGYLTWIVLPLVFYVVEKDKRSLVAWHAREAFNFQVNVMIYYGVTFVLACLFFLDIWFLVAGSLLFTALAIFELVVIILASLAAGRGERYRYPLTIPVIPRPSDYNPYEDRD